MSKYRHEYKYLIDSRQMAVLKLRAEGILRKDSHVDQDGSYRVRSLYFDDMENNCYIENEGGTDPRWKFRIRYYGGKPEILKLEKKSRQKGMTRKEFCLITREECEQFMRGEIPYISKDFLPEKQMLFAEIKMKRLMPKVIVSYQRIPYVAVPGNVRVTLDFNIVSSGQIRSFLGESDWERPILSGGMQVLEVKWDEFLPSYIKECLSLPSLQWTSFSKYYLCRKYSTNGGLA